MEGNVLDKPIAHLDIPATPLIREHSSTPVPDDLGSHASTMDLYWIEGSPKGTGRGYIEWDIPALDEGEGIGVWTERGSLSDYDGVMSLPRECVTILRSVGIRVGRDFIH